jgi:DNA-directed RNA polymerase subunit RPC12/RpoP
MNIKNQKAGNTGELEIIKLIQCPNCGKKLMQLPNSFPLYDVQCTACFFRAQVKSSNGSKPRNIIRGAGWDIMEKVLKSGALVPSLITNSKWQESGKKHQEIRFYPFIRKISLKKYTANIKSRGRKYKMFNYDLKNMKFFVLYLKPKGIKK